MGVNSKKASKVLSLDNVWLPILVGLVVPLYLFSKHSSHFDSTHFKELRLVPFWVAIFFIILRDLAFMCRLRVLTQNYLSWLKCFYIIVLWDFSSAVTPSIVGGGVVVVFLLVREGIKLGSALAYIMVTTIIDNCFFMAIAPFGYWGAYYTPFSNVDFMASDLGNGLKIVFFIGFFIVFLYTSLVSFSLWIRPKFLKWLLVWICTKIKFLRKWKRSMIRHGNDIVLASESLKNKSSSYWGKIILFTSLGILCRYVVLNSLVCMCKDLNFMQHIVVFSNQVVLWVVMLVSPTPGSSGTAEFFFTELFQNLLGEYLLIIEMLWRILTYYLHIIVGAIVLSKWFKRPKSNSYS
jgi:uncharacterized protein (TIRG00374 family)